MKKGHPQRMSLKGSLLVLKMIKINQKMMKNHLNLMRNPKRKARVVMIKMKKNKNYKINCMTKRLNKFNVIMTIWMKMKSKVNIQVMTVTIITNNKMKNK